MTFFGIWDSKLRRTAKRYYACYFHYADYLYYVCYVHYLDILLCRFASDLVSQITCGRRSALLSPRQLMHWAISFVQQCVLVGFLKSRQPILIWHPTDEKSLDVLMDAQLDM